MASISAVALFVWLTQAGPDGTSFPVFALFLGLLAVLAALAGWRAERRSGARPASPAAAGMFVAGCGLLTFGLVPPLLLFVLTKGQLHSTTVRFLGVVALFSLGVVPAAALLGWLGGRLSRYSRLRNAT
jgi:hypothetical protein